jgi:hypothetical protein
MARFLKILATAENVKSPDGTPLGPLPTPNLLPLTSVVSLSVVASRDANDHAIIRGLALLISTAASGTVPVAILGDTNDAVKRKEFQDYVDDVLTRASGTDDVVTIEVKTF